MQHLEDQLAAFADLSPEERAEVIAHVERHPEWADALADAQASAAVFDDVRALLDAPVSDDALAHYLLTEPYQAEAPADVAAWLRRVEHAIAEDDDVRARYEQLRARLPLIDALGTAEHFEKMTGMPLPDTAQPSTDAPLLAGRIEPGYQRLAEPSRVWAWRPFLMAATVVLFAVYGVLFWAGDAFRPTAERLAMLTTAEATWSAPTLRSDRSDIDPQAERLERAVALLTEAPTSTLGLFPRYDTDRIARALVLLDGVLTEADPATPLGSDALYYKGKAQLALGKTAEARASLRRAAAAEGPSATAAERLLARLNG